MRGDQDRPAARGQGLRVLLVERGEVGAQGVRAGAVAVSTVRVGRGQALGDLVTDGREAQRVHPEVQVVVDHRGGPGDVDHALGRGAAERGVDPGLQAGEGHHEVGVRQRERLRRRQLGLVDVRAGRERAAHPGRVTGDPLAHPLQRVGAGDDGGAAVVLRGGGPHRG